MKLLRRLMRTGRLAVVAALTFLGTTPTLAQGKSDAADHWPSRPVRFIVPFAAGGGTDIVARFLTKALEQMLGQPFIVENRPGAQGSIGAQFVARSAPDGYTVLVGSIGTQAVNQYLYASLPYNPEKDFVPVTVLTKTNTVMTVPMDSRFKSLAELIQYAKANPDKLSYGVPAVGDAGHLFFEKLKYELKIPAVAIPYNSVPVSLNDVAAGRLDFVVTSVVAQTPLITGGKLRPIVVTGDARSNALPDVPTIAEAGYPGYEASSWSGLFMPAGTDPAIVAKLSAAVAKAWAQPELLAEMRARGFEVTSLPPKEFEQFVAGQRAKWSKVIKDANIKLEQ